MPISVLLRGSSSYFRKVPQRNSKNMYRGSQIDISPVPLSLDPPPCRLCTSRGLCNGIRKETVITVSEENLSKPKFQTRPSEAAGHLESNKSPSPLILISIIPPQGPARSISGPVHLAQLHPEFQDSAFFHLEPNFSLTPVADDSCNRS